MKLFIMMMAVCLAGTSMPAAANGSARINVKDTTETKTGMDCCPTEKRQTFQKTRTRNVTGSDLMLSQKEKMRRPVIRVYTCPIHAEVVSDKPGRCPECSMLLHRHSKEKTKVSLQKTYACSVHPDVTGKKGSTCAQCGTTLKLQQHASPRHSQAAPACLNRSKAGKCRSCSTELMRSSKEKMKMEVMKICCCSTEPAFIHHSD